MDQLGLRVILSPLWKKMTDGAIGHPRIEVPDLIEPVIGYRHMHVVYNSRTDNCVIYSMHDSFMWGLENTARCDKGFRMDFTNEWIPEHIAPGENCQCGLYCYYEPDRF